MKCSQTNDYMSGNQPTFATDTTHCGGEVLSGSPDCQCFDSENLD